MNRLHVFWKRVPALPIEVQGIVHGALFIIGLYLVSALLFCIG